MRKQVDSNLFINTIISSGKDRRDLQEDRDCVVRAFMSALDVPYLQAHSFVKKYLKREDRKGTYTTTHFPNVVGRVKNGKRVSLLGASPDYISSLRVRARTRVKELTNPRYKAKRGYTVGSFMENFDKGRYVVIVEGHAIAVVDGRLYGNRTDTYSPRRRVRYVFEIK